MFCPVIIQQKPLMVNGKGKGTYIVPQAATAAVLYVTDRAGLQPIGCRLSPRRRDFDLRRTAVRSPDLPINGLHPRMHELLLIYRSQRDGRLSWPGWLTHSGHFTHKVVTCPPYISASEVMTLWHFTNMFIIIIIIIILSPLAKDRRREH